MLGAVGLAGKQNALAMALARLFCGDNRAAGSVVIVLSKMAWRKANDLRVKLRRVQADDIARAVLAWHRDGVCKACGGHGYRLIHGAPAIGDVPCPSCRGIGKVAFDRHFAHDHRPVACWLLAEVEREQARAGPAAMAKIAERMGL